MRKFLKMAFWALGLNLLVASCSKEELEVQEPQIIVTYRDGTNPPEGTVRFVDLQSYVSQAEVNVYKIRLAGDQLVKVDGQGFDARSEVHMDYVMRETLTVGRYVIIATGFDTDGNGIEERTQVFEIPR